jgi:hypothetical protein
VPKPTKAKPSEAKLDDALEVKPKKEPAAGEEEWEDESDEGEKDPKKFDGDSDDQDDAKEAKKARKVGVSKRK